MDFEVKQNGKTVPFRFTFGTNILEMMPAKTIPIEVMRSLT
jgi:hypothetical protein